MGYGYSILFALEFFLFFVFLKRMIRGDVTKLVKQPIYIALIFNFIIGVLVPYLQYEVQYYRYQLTYSYDVMLMGNMLVMVSMLMLFIGHGFAKKKAVTVKVKKPKKIEIYSVVLLLVLPAIYAAFTLISQIQSIGYDAYITDRISHGVSQGYLKSFVGNLYVSALLFYGYILVLKESNDSYLFPSLILILVVSIFVYYQVLTGNRNSLFVFIVGGFMIGYRLKSRVKIKKAVPLVIGMLIVLVFFSYGAKWRKEAVLGSEIEQSQIETLVQGLNGAFGNHENLLWLIGNDFDLKLGATYLAAFSNVIPRKLWPDKPTGGGPALVNTIYPGKYVVGGEGNSSLTTGLNTEAFLNFSYLGLVIVPFFFGVLIAIITHFFAISKTLLGLTCSMVLALSFSVLFVYSEFLGLIARTGLTVIPIAVIYFFTNKLKIK